MEFEQLYKAIVDQASDAIIFADPQGLIRLWNAGAEAIFGFSSTEALNQSLDLIIPADLRRAHSAGFEFAMKASHTKYGRKVMTTRSMNEKGETIYVNLSFSVVVDGSGTPMGALARARDFTARYFEEKRLRKQVEDLERRVKEGK